METTWIVLANDCRLKVLEIQGSDGIHHEIVDFFSPNGKMGIKKSFETIRPDSFTQTHPASSDINEADICNAQFQKRILFSKQISSYIERARQKGCFEKMRIVGGGGFIKLLRKNMTEKTKCLIEKEFIDDAIDFEQPILERYFN